MTALAAARGWRASTITAVGEVLSPTRITAAAAQVGVQLFLVVCLWRALYAHTHVSAGLTEPQAVSYAILAALAMRIRGTGRWQARDMVIQHVQLGTIVYWYLRPLSPQRYYFWREAGDQVYGLAWAAAGYLVCLALGVMKPPASVAGAGAFALTFALGMSILYYLVLLTDQMCFWMIKNGAVVAIVAFAQNLLSGGYAALWFYPHWFQVGSAVLPFEYTMGIPLSFYVGRLGISDLPREVAAAVLWMIILALFTRFLWRRAGERVVSQGG